VRVIDSDGFRANVGIVLCNRQGQVLWARRCGQEAWQFPQGGIMRNETPEAAMYRELKEEVGLDPNQVRVISSTDDWLRYRLPKRFIRHNRTPVCIGQKQIWFLLELAADDEAVSLNCCDKPEFDCWRWVEFWYPLQQVVSFKRDVYQQALAQFAPVMQRMWGMSVAAWQYPDPSKKRAQSN
jgi:putative (di)nucleoside polyphosphate hydrolase